MTILVCRIKICNCRFRIILQIISYQQRNVSCIWIKMFKENSMTFACFLLNQYMVMCMGHYKYTNILPSCMRAWAHTAFKVLSSTKCSKSFLHAEVMVFDIINGNFKRFARILKDWIDITTIMHSFLSNVSVGNSKT